jgi:hypothetical protein
VIITINSHAGKVISPDVREQSGAGGPETHTDVRPYLFISTPFHFPFIFQLRAPSDLLSAAVPAL